MNTNNIKSIFICSLLMFSSLQTVYSQSSENSNVVFGKENLMGKKWVYHYTIKSNKEKYLQRHGTVTVGKKKITRKVGSKIVATYVFDNDSVSYMVMVDNDTVTTRYAYYLSDSYDYKFDSSKIGKDNKGTVINLQGQISLDDKERTENSVFKIWKLTDEELVIENRKRFVKLKAEP